MENEPKIYTVEEIENSIEILLNNEPKEIEATFVSIAVFAPYKDNESANPTYFDELAEKLGIPFFVLVTYAIKNYRKILER